MMTTSATTTTTTTSVDNSRNNAIDDEHNMTVLKSKELVLNFHKALEEHNHNNTNNNTNIQSILDEYVLEPSSYPFLCVYPFRELTGTATVASRFWQPLNTSFSHLQRRPDIFIGGKNQLHNNNNNNNNEEEEGAADSSVWVLSMGHFMGLFDQDWLGIRYTRQLATIRYAEFNQVARITNTNDGSHSYKIVQTGLFLDIIGLMQSVGMNPLPPSTGAFLASAPGPKSHNGLQYCTTNAPFEEGKITQALVDRMVDDLSSINQSFTCDPALLQRTWNDNMAWYGPAGIGGTYTIARYQEQHQLPFRSRLADKQFHGHQVRVAEGEYAAFFGWPMNLTNVPLGGFLGMTGGSACKDCPMQVVDVYRREGDKLAENWVLIDILWYLKHQGLDALERTTGILNPASLKMLPDTKQAGTFDLSKKVPATNKSSTHISRGSSHEEEKKSPDDEYMYVPEQNKETNNNHTNNKESFEHDIDMSNVTHASTVDISEILCPITNQKSMPMPGFDDTFIDIVDYILRITYWIWHEKKVDLCIDYYSNDCLLHTMAGDIVGADTVVKNTWATLDVFPDRTLDGDNVVWSREPRITPAQEKQYGTTYPNPVVYYSSHLITSRMTNKGDSEWGPATNILARIRTIADCVCTENKIVEEWLMRDNAHLVMTLGFDVHNIARQQAEKDVAKGGQHNLLTFLEPERKRVQANAISKDLVIPSSHHDLPRIKSTVNGNSTITSSCMPVKEVRAFAESLFNTLWQHQDYDKVSIFYDYRVNAHLTSGRDVYGTIEMKNYLNMFQTGLENIHVSIDHVACIPYLGDDAFDVAIRWTLTADHTGDSTVLGKASNTPIYILGGSHYRIIRNRIREEWTVFDELALLRQIETQRIMNGN